ncbi:MAG: extracellular solute-binding protein [Candidatus Gracilibacteria bacterium]
MKRLLITFLVVSISASVLTGCIFNKAPAAGPIALTVYGLDDSDVMDPIIAKYKAKYPTVSVKYKKFADPASFESLMVNEIAENEGPDIFYLHNTWLPRHLKKIVPLTSTTLTTQNFSDTYVNVAKQDFIQPDPKDGIDKIYALPLYVDTLGMYYNKQIFEQKIPERGKPASNWDIFKEDASKIRQQSTDGKLEVSAIAMGRSDNISLATDILYNLFLQSGAKMYNDDYTQVSLASAGSKAFDYFMSFGASNEKNFSWNTDLAVAGQPAGEVEAFLSGKVASILAYSDLYPRLENELKNVKSRTSSAVEMKNIAVTPVPQMSAKEAEYRVWANYYGLAVSRVSKNPAQAWNFVQFATTTDSAKVYHQKTKKPTARRDLIEEQKKEPITDVFVSQLGYASSYKVFSDKDFADYLKEAITATSSGRTARQAFNDAEEKMNGLLKLQAPEGLYPKPPVVKKK